MQFDELRKELKNIVFITVREESDDYFEGVVSKGELAHLSLILGKFFGARAWPSEHKLSEEIENFVAEFGGIMSNQTLYFHKETSILNKRQRLFSMSLVELVQSFFLWKILLMTG